MTSTRSITKPIFFSLAVAAFANAATVSVYFEFGQSNADGRDNANCLSESDIGMLSGIRILEGNVSNVTIADSDIWQGSSSQYGPELGLAQNLSSGDVIIKFATGSSNLFNDWLPNGNSSTSGDGVYLQSFYATVSSSFSTLQNEGLTPVVKGALWVQGERDARLLRSATEYAGNLALLEADLFATLGQNFPLIIAGLNDNQTNLSSVGIDQIQAGQVSYTDNSSFGILMDTEGFQLQSDNLHYSCEGYFDMGDQAGELVNYFNTIPEPSTGLLASLPFMALLLSRNRKSNS